MSRFDPIVRSWTATTRSLPQFTPARRLHARQRFTMERLEGRSLLSTISLTVNTLGDDPSGPTNGQLTLRDAINQADADTASSYVIDFSVTGTIDLTSPLPDLDNNISLGGPGASDLTVQRDPNAPDFSVFTADREASRGHARFPVKASRGQRLRGVTPGFRFTLRA